MKKIVSALSAAILTAASVMPYFTNAEDYIPLMYMKMKDSQYITTDNDGTIVIKRQALENGLTLSADVFIEDESLKCWSVSPKWKSSSSFLKLTEAYDPIPKDGSPMLPFAYAVTDNDGNFISSSTGTLLTINRNYNVINFTCMRQSLTDLSPLEPYGEKSDDYPLVTFDMSVNRNIPSGEYDVYFLTHSEDYEDQRYSEVALRTEGSPVYIPRTQNLHFRIEGFNLGDVNNDGIIDADDASLVLTEYSNVSTGKAPTFTEDQTYAADVNNDSLTDADDASAILSYYSYLSTTDEAEPVTLKSFISQQ